MLRRIGTSGFYTAAQRIEAVILADFVAEGVAKVAGPALGIAVTRDLSLFKLLGELEATLGKTGTALPERGRIEHLRDVRNLAQHRAEPPNAATAQRAAEDVEEFADRLTTAIWGLSFRALSRVSLVESEKLRSYLDHAARSLASGDRDQALAAIAYGAHMLRVLVADGPRWARRNWEHDLSALIIPSTSDARLRLSELGASIDALILEIELMRAGLSGPDYRWFRRLIPEVTYTMDGAGHLNYVEPGPSLDELNRALELLLDWALSADIPPRPIPPMSGLPWREITVPSGYPTTGKEGPLEG